LGIYERFGVKPIINVFAPATSLGGPLMDQEVLEAMDEAAKASVRLDELQAAASKVIAKITHAEAGIVTCGAYVALTLATAACITGFDVARMNRLPDTTGMPNEVVMPWHQISAYDHSIRLPGVKIIGAGIPMGTTPPHQVHIISKWDVESAITQNTVAIAYAPRFGSHPPLEEIIEIGKRYDIPVIADAAAQVPPVENLHRFIDMGVDLVCFSGGKGIRGPQASGILCGRRDLVASAAVQMLDMGGLTFYGWEPPASLIPKDKFRSRPQHGIGRGAKVSKEVIIGLLVALENLTEGEWVKKAGHLRELLGSIQAKLEGVAGLEMRMTEDYKGGYPMLEVKIDDKVLGRSAAEVARRLKDGDPGIYIRDRYLNQGFVIIHSINMDEQTAKIVGERLYAAITGD
jgi:D-glucosaminate-6-phosphate ammonia-lyase